MDATLLKNICEYQETGQPVALVTIIETKGSTPRKAGSQMLVLPTGAVQGTIGGGCAEAEAKQQALLALQHGKPCLCTVEMLNAVAADEGMVCGGTMTLFMQVL
nr:XdhC family protein [uncultured Anaeromusa sp.]